MVEIILSQAEIEQAIREHLIARGVPDFVAQTVRLEKRADEHGGYRDLEGNGDVRACARAITDHDFPTGPYR